MKSFQVRPPVPYIFKKISEYPGILLDHQDSMLPGIETLQATNVWSSRITYIGPKT